MKLSIRSILLTCTLVIGANTLLVAQTTNSWAEQWYRAKYGRPSPTEEARIQPARQASEVHEKATAGEATAPANTRFEGPYRVKPGRPSPTEGARLKSEQANTAPRGAVTSNGAPVNNWYDGWRRANFARQSTLEGTQMRGHTR